MYFKKYPVIKQLQPYILYYWSLENSSAQIDKKDFQIIADGSPGLIFQPHSKGKLVFEGNQELPEIFVCGQTTLSAQLSIEGTFSIIGAAFYPDALKTVFRLNASEITNNCLNVQEVLTEKEKSLLNKLWEKPSPVNRVGIISQLLLSLINRNSNPKDVLIDYCLSRLISSQGKEKIRDLCRGLQLSERTLERKFKLYIGVSPKQFARICQFQASLSHLHLDRELDICDIAYENNFADESHFIRTFKTFSGTTPSRYLKKWSNFADMLIKTDFLEDSTK